MTSVSKTNTFVPGTDIESAEVNQNFDDLVGYINTNAITKDGALAFTGIPSGPATDPSNANHLVRKQYVDGVLGFSSGTTPLYTIAATVKSAFATMTTNVLNRLKVTDVTTPLVTAKPTVATTQFTIVAGTGTVGVNTISQAVTFPTAFPNGVVTVVASIGDSTGVTAIQTNGYSKTGFTVNGYALLTAIDGVTQLFGALNGPWRYNYVAIGW